jgi:hypothetical protein
LRLSDILLVFILRSTRVIRSKASFETSDWISHLRLGLRVPLSPSNRRLSLHLIGQSHRTFPHLATSPKPQFTLLGIICPLPLYYYLPFSCSCFNTVYLTDATPLDPISPSSSLIPFISAISTLILILIHHPSPHGARCVAGCFSYVLALKV